MSNCEGERTFQKLLGGKTELLFEVELPEAMPGSHAKSFNRLRV